MKLANSATAAMTADPIANPFVTALVVLPTASRLTMIRSGGPWNSPDISAMPAALSATGPNVSSLTTTPVAAPMARAMAMMAQTELSSPDEMPDSTVVAGPVRADSAISRTGAVSVDV